MRDLYTPTFNPAEREMFRWRWHESAGYVFPPSWWDSALNRDLTGETYRLLHALLASMGWQNRVGRSLGMIGRRLGMAEAQRTRALRHLAEARLVAVDRSDTRGLVITVSPSLVWQGRPPGVYEARKHWADMCAGLPIPDETMDEDT